MRNVSSAITTAINNVHGTKINTRITAYNNRVFIEETDVDFVHATSYAQTPEIHDESTIFQDSAFDTNLNLVVSVCNISTGYRLSLEGLTTPTDITTSCAVLTRPTIVAPYIYYQKVDGSLVRDTYSYSTNVFTITETEEIDSGNLFPGSLYGLTGDAAIHIYINDGGIGISKFELKNSIWTCNTWLGRIMFPTEIWTSTMLYKLNFATAIRTTNAIFVYISIPSGEVIGIKILPNENWTDTFISFPQDLSIFYIANSVVDSSDRIHLCGQFVRTDNWNSGSIYTLSLWSDDGIVFSLDRFTLVSTLGYRFMLSLGRNKEIFSDANRIAIKDSSYTFYKTSSTNEVITEIIDINGSSNTGWQIVVANGNSKYTNDLLLSIGNIIKLEIGIQSLGTTTWQIYDNAIISQVDNTLADGIRGLNLQIVSEGLWKAQVATYPFGMVLQSKQSIRDDVDAMDNLSLAPNQHGIWDPFCVTFSIPDIPFKAVAKNQSTPMDNWSGDLVSDVYLSDYPVIETFPLTISMFGWSRIGLIDSNPNVADNTSSALPNDTFTPMFLVIGTDGEERTIVIPSSDAVNNIDYPPQTWKTGNARNSTGTYPVVFSIASDVSGLLIGDKIKKVGIRVYSTSPTVYYLERIEIPEVSMYMAGTYYGGTLGEEFIWEEIPYIPPVIPTWPPIIFPPIVFPPIVYPPPPPPEPVECGHTGDESEATGPYYDFKNPRYLIGTKDKGMSFIRPFSCRLHATSDPYPSFLLIDGQMTEINIVSSLVSINPGYLTSSSPTSYRNEVVETSTWEKTTRTDFCRIEALDADYNIVATAIPGAHGPYGEYSEIHDNDMIYCQFENEEQVDISFLRYVIDKSEISGGAFTVNEDGSGGNATPFRPTKVERTKQWYMGTPYDYDVWPKRGVLTWKYTPGGIEFIDKDKEHSAWWYWSDSIMQESYIISGGNASNYSQYSYPNWTSLKTIVVNYSTKPRITNATGPYFTSGEAGSTYPSWCWMMHYLSAGGGNSVVCQDSLIPGEYKEITFQPYSYSSNYYQFNHVLYGKHCHAFGGGRDMDEHWTHHVYEDEFKMKLTFPGFEQEGHLDNDTMIYMDSSAMYSVCNFQE